MAKRKGKSRRRIKDWKKRYEAGEEAGDVAARRQRLAPKEVKLPSWRAEGGWENLDGFPQREGVVVGQFPGGATVRTDDGELLCGIAGTFRAPEGASPLAFGDVVTVALTRDEQADEAQDDRDRADGMILSRRPRRTVLSRPQPRSGKFSDPYADEPFEKVLVANADALAIVATRRRPRVPHALIDRFLIIAERGELEPILVFNKTDVARPDPRLVEQFRRLEIPVVECSAVEGDGLSELRNVLSGRCSVLAGPSGVGKSTLINAVVPEAEAATRSVRDRDERGRHTTTAARIYDLPGGGRVIDTPGVRELAVRLDAAELPWYFPEFESVAPRCRFNDCTHTHEPGCAVIEAVEGGDIPSRRYESYLRLLDDLAD